MYFPHQIQVSVNKPTSGAPENTLLTFCYVIACRVCRGGEAKDEDLREKLGIVLFYGLEGRAARQLL